MTTDAQTYAGASQVQHAFFVMLNFLNSSPVYIWNGYRNITLNGHTWVPVGPLATVDALEDQLSDSAAQVIMRVSGVDTAMLSIALSSADEVRGQLAFIYDQYFDTNWNPVGSFDSYAVVRMDTVKVKRAQDKDGQWTRVIEVPSEYLLTNGPNPAGGRYTTADQLLRYPGLVDTYFQFISQLQNKVIRWPTF